MSQRIREIINGINKGKDENNLLHEYVAQSMSVHDSFARVKMMMDYYLFYEVLQEESDSNLQEVKDMIEQLNMTIRSVLLHQPDNQAKEELAQTLLNMRQEVMDRMQVLTGYVDCFVLYEYVLNRIQYRFEPKEAMPDDNTFARQIMNFIFSSQDNVTINDNLRFVLGQLPMRMTRRHYFDLLRDCISVYQGSEVSSLESFLYMFRTSALLYKDPNADKYFTEFSKVIEEFSTLDYDTFDKQTYEIYAEKIRINASKLNDLSDLYLQIGTLINETYTLVLTGQYQENMEEYKVANEVLIGINDLFVEKDSDVWKANEIAEYDEEDRIIWLGNQLTFSEGKQEHLFDSINVAEAALEDIIRSQKAKIDSESLTEEYTRLYHISMMNSTSVFAPLSPLEENQELVSSEYAKKVTDELIEELTECFQGQSRLLRRGIMAQTIEKFPTFFHSAQEIADYVIGTLNQCDDEAEKYAAKQIILDIIGE